MSDHLAQTAGIRFLPSFPTALLRGAALCVLLSAAAAHAIQPVTWSHTTEADFADGKVDHTVVTNLGDIKLATGSRVLGEAPEGVTVIYDLQQVDGATYVAAGPKGALLQLDGDELVELVSLETEQVFALAQHDGRLIVAVSAAGASRLAALRDGELDTLVELPDVRYVWDLASLGGDDFAVATGTDGKVLRVSLDGAVTELLDAEQVNMLSLAVTDDGTIYAGSDVDGLVFRITVDGDEVETFVVYDADEPEIGALLAVGNVLYVGTADAEQAKPGRLADASAEEAGRPAGAPVPAEAAEPPAEGEAPVEPEVPNVEPDPQPLEAQPQSDAEPEAETENEPPSSEPPTDAGDGAAAAPAPTADQYDALRETVRARLADARRTGQLQVEGLAGPTGGGRPAGGSSAQRARPARAAAKTKEGNAIYRIDADGFVREVFRESVMILRLVQPHPGAPLFVLTGNEGQIYRVDPAADETTVLIDLDVEQIVAAVPGQDGELLIGTANPAQVLAVDRRFAPTGTYTSKVLDAAQVSLFGTLTVTGRIPRGASVTVETRSGNAADPEVAAWSPWSTAQAFMPDDDLPELEPREMKIASPPARYLQYRLTLTGNVETSPTVERVEATYVTPNLRPAITSLTAAYPEPKNNDAPPPTDMEVEWEATDGNTDPLFYKLEYRPAGSERFLLLAEDLTETSYTWPTQRVPDGRYVLRVTADDRAANPGSMALSAVRVSDPVLVDNTPPAIEAEYRRNGRTLTITGTVRDRHSKVRDLAYSLDGDEQYQPILPQDLIFDSTSEAFEVTIVDLAPGPHVVTLRASDARRNRTHEAVLVD